MRCFHRNRWAPALAIYAAICCLSCPAAAAGQGDDAAVELGEIRVAADDDGGAAPLTVQRLQRQQLDALPAGSAAEAIGRLPSAQALTNSRGEELLQLRGFDQQQLLILIDGVPSAVPFDGVLDLGKVPLPVVERIEVVQGAGDVAYGPGGLGGAINLITRRPGETPLLELRFEGAPLHELRASLVHGAKVGPFTYAVFGTLDGRANFPLPSSFAATANQPAGDRIDSAGLSGSGGGTVEVQLAECHRLILSGQAIGGSYGLPPSTVSPRPRYWRFDPWIAANASLRHVGEYLDGRLEIEEALFASPFGNTLRSYDDPDYTTQASRKAFTSRYDDLAAGGFLRALWRLDPSWARELNARLWFGGRYEQHAEHTEGSAASPEYDHWLLTFAPQLDARFTSWLSAALGVQLDAEVPQRFSGVIEPRNQVTAGPLASLTFEPHERVTIALSAARRARFPTLKERFADAFGQRAPNPELGAEQAWNFALDVAARLPAGFSLSASGFDSEVSGLIVRAPLPGGIYQLQNAGRSRLAGLEAALAWRHATWGLRARGGYQFLSAQRLDVPSPQSQLEYRPEHKAYAMLSWEFLKGYELMNEAVIIGPRPFLDTDSGGWGRLPTDATWNVKLSGELRPWLSLWLQATNLLDAEVSGEYGYPGPGREIWAGLSTTLGKRTGSEAARGPAAAGAPAAE